MSIAYTKLREQFPMLRSREEVKQEIQANADLYAIYLNWGDVEQEQFLDFVTGTRGTKTTYDFMFQQIMNPDIMPERLEDFLSLVLKQHVEIIEKLDNKEHFMDESSLLETDVVVRFRDGSIANVEIQKIGYMFPGERSACYSADLLLRQYRKVRSTKKAQNKHFSYKDLRTVFTIVLFEKSSREFHKDPAHYIHNVEMKADTNLELNLLQKYVFISLDIFGEIYKNKGIRTKLEAWLVFFGQDQPEAVLDLITRYPQFREYYDHVYKICRDLENVMGFFSEELRMMDRNTTKLMIDELEETVKAQKAQLEDQATALSEKDAALTAKDAALTAKDAALTEKDAALTAKEAALTEKEAELSEKDRIIADLQRQLAGKKA